MAELKTVTKIDHTSGHTNKTFYDLHPHLANGHVSENSVHPTNNVQEQKDLNQEMSKFQIVKNLIVLSFGFLFLFTAFGSMSNLQSSVNQALGTLSLSAIYAGLVFSCMFVPSVMIGLLGEKCTVAVSMVMYSFFFMANFYPRWYTLIPASVIMGLGGAPLWTAKCSYLTTISRRYALHVGQPSDSYIVPFFGFFFMVFQTSQIWGNLISYKILTPENSDLEIPVSNLSQCGPSFSAISHGGNDTNNSLSSIPANFNLLCGVYTGCALMAALVVFILLDPLDKKAVRVVEKPSLATLMITLRHLKKPYQLLLIPLTIFSGMGQAYITGDFTQAYVTCGWGVNYVGYVMICFGVTNAVCSCALGIKIQPLGRLILMITANSITGVMIIVMFLWVPTINGNRVLYFVIAGLWGVGDAVWATYVNAFYGVLFPHDKEAAFSNFRLWQSVGFIFSFAYSSYLSIPVKLAILVVFLISGTAGYLAIEIHLRSTRNHLINDASSPSSPNKKPS